MRAHNNGTTKHHQAQSSTANIKAHHQRCSIGTRGKVQAPTLHMHTHETREYIRETKAVAHLSPVVCARAARRHLHTPTLHLVYSSA